MRLLPIALGLPGTIGFPTAIAHHRSPHRQVTEVSYAGKNIIAYHPSHGNAAPTSRMDCFVDSLLGLARCVPAHHHLCCLRVAERAINTNRMRMVNASAP